METLFLESACICWESTSTPKQNIQLCTFSKTNCNNNDINKTSPYKFNPYLNKKLFIA